MSATSDGGLTWGEPRETADRAVGLAGQPVVHPNGTVVVPFVDSSIHNLRAFRSIDGGASWSETVRIAPIFRHIVAGRMRSHPLPSAAVDAAGRVYVAWHDCRF